MINPSPDSGDQMKKSLGKKETKSNIVYVTPGVKPSNQRTIQSKTVSPQASRSKRKINLRGLLLILFSLWALYTFLFVLMPNKARLGKEQQKIEQQYTDLKHQEQKLNGDIKNFQDDSYIARLARRYYNMVKDGEILYHPHQ